MTSGFDRLLRQLDPDREKAGEEYERIRLRITKLFVWRGCPIADELADRTMERVERRLDEGAEIYAANPYSFVHGVALLVLREWWREAGRRSEVPLDPNEVVAPPPSAIDEAAERRRYTCLDRCLAGLPASARQLLRAYHGQQGTAIAARRQLARAMSIPINALRIRLHRLRAELRVCIEECLRHGTRGPAAVE